MSDPLKLCLVSSNAYPVINPSASGVFGGMETGAWEFARALARLPQVDVAFVVEHRDAPAWSQVEHIDIINGKTWVDVFREDIVNLQHDVRRGQRPGLQRLVRTACQTAALLATRPFRVRHDQEWKRAWRSLVAVKADVYAATGVCLTAARVVQTAHQIHRPSVLLLMSDADLNPRFREEPGYIDPYGVQAEHAAFVLSHVDAIFAQTRKQQELLRAIWNREAALIPNALDVTAWDAAARQPLPSYLPLPTVPFVLWIGRADRFHKRPLEMLAVVRALPETPFVMILNPKEADIRQTVLSQDCPNLTVIEQVPFGLMPALMARSALLASTGSADYEGLPNVFLQAAALKRPVITLEAGEEWLASSGAGFCARGDREAFIACIRRCLSQPDAPDVRAYGESGRRYVEQEHNEPVVSHRFIAALRALTFPRP